MNTSLAPGVCALFCGAIFMACAATASAAGECDANKPATPPKADHYDDLPVLIILHRGPSAGAEQPAISTICLGQNPYTPQADHHDIGPQDMEIDADKVTVTFWLGSDLKITRWSAPGNLGDPGGIRMVRGLKPRKPKKGRDWPRCSKTITAVNGNDAEFSFDFSGCTHNLYYRYGLDFECKPGAPCKNISPIDPQIINRPHTPLEIDKPR